MNFGPGLTTKLIPVDGATVTVAIGGDGPGVVLFH